jgi:hypothetical protein
VSYANIDYLGVRTIKMRSRKRVLTKVVAMVVTAMVILIVLYSGPAEAYTLSLSTANTNVTVGEKVNLSASVKIDNSELLNISSLELKLKSINPSVNISCKFLPNGTVISGCAGMTITQVESTPFGYGYINNGYGYGFKPGTLKYDIVLNTSGYAPGRYNTYINFSVGNQTFEKTGDIINIKKAPNHIRRTIPNSCNFSVGQSIFDKNIRGVSGSGILVANGTAFDNEKLILTARSKGANRGEGTLTAQIKQSRFTVTRFSYTFKINKVVENDTTALLYLKGNYKTGFFKKPIPLETVLTLNKQTGLVSLSGDGVSLTGMQVIYNGKGCSAGL